MPAEAAQSHSQGHAAQELRVEFREQRTRRTVTIFAAVALLHV